MKIICERCAGLDAHKKSVVACVRVKGQQETRTFTTMTEDLLVLSDWLLSQEVPHVAMESTGDFGIPSLMYSPENKYLSGSGWFDGN